MISARGEREPPHALTLQHRAASIRRKEYRRPQRAQRSETMTFRIAIVQPISHRPGEDEKNVAAAGRAVERAAGAGAAFVCFPETYPGPWRMPATFDPTAALAEAAATHGVHVVFGTIEPIDRKAATAYNLIVMAYPDGRAPSRYRRTHPNGPWIYTGGP